MNVLFLTKYDVSHYGVAEVLRGLAGALRGCGVEVCVYSSDPSAKTGEWPGGGICQHGPLPPPGGWGGREAVRRIGRFAEEHGVELIHAHGLYRAGRAAQFVRNATGLPYVATSHGDLLDVGRLRRWRVRRRYRAVLRDAEAVTHLSGVMADAAHRLLDVRHKGVTIPNGIDTGWWSRAERLDGGYVLAAGRLVPEKGFGVLVEAWGRLAGRGVRVPLVIAGRGPMEGDLRRRASELGLEVVDGFDPHASNRGTNGTARVHFAGFVGGEAKRALFTRCRLVTFPTQPKMPEAFGIVMIEAMAAGKAIVAGDLPIPREILRGGEHGLLVPARDASSWADAIERLLRDEPLRRRYGQANLVEAERYDWRAVARQYAQLYHRVKHPEGAPIGAG